MNPFSVHFREISNSVKHVVYPFQFDSYFINFWGSLNEHAFGKPLDQHLITSPLYSEWYYYPQNIYTSREIYLFFQKHFSNLKIKVNPLNLCLIVCYLCDYKKALIRIRDLNKFNMNEYQKFCTAYEALIKYRPTSIIFNNGGKKHIKIELPKDPQIDFSPIQNSLNEHLYKIKLQAINDYKVKYKIFFTPGFTFKVVFRKYVANSLLNYLNEHAINTKSDIGKSSQSQRDIIGLFYYLFRLTSKSDKDFEKHEKQIPSNFYQTPNDTIFDDLKGYGKFAF
jgi:hypothetical protein